MYDGDKGGLRVDPINFSVGSAQPGTTGVAPSGGLFRRNWFWEVGTAPCSPFLLSLAVNRRDGLVRGYELKCGGVTEEGYVGGGVENVVPAVGGCGLEATVGLTSPLAAKTDGGMAWINCSSCLIRASIPAVFLGHR